MDDLEQLEYLSLVSKVASELQNHLQISDKTLAEFIIDTHGKTNSIDEFKAALQDMGAEFPASLVESIDRLVLTLHPKYKKKKEDTKENVDQKTRVFKGLAIPDKEPVFADEPADVDSTLDDTFAMLEGLAPGKKRKSPEEDDMGKSKRQRAASRNDDYLFEDEFGRTRAVSRHGDSEKRPRRQRRDSDDGDYERKPQRRHRYSDDDDDFRRPPPQEIDEVPILYKVYSGRVTGIKDFGVFVNLQGVRGKVDGLVHVSQIQEGARVENPADLLQRNQQVKVKVIKQEGSRLSLSMKEVDQESGRDLAPHRRIASGANAVGNMQDDIVPIIGNTTNGQRQRKRMTSPERWEIKQLIASGVIPKSEYPDIDEDYRDAINGEGGFEEEEDVDIEIREEEPPFLAGQTKQSLELSPIRVVKAPEGSMNRAAMAGDTLARERRDLKQQEAQEKASKEAAQVDLSSQWNDPMAQQRQFASDVRNARTNQPAGAIPEWKKIATGRDASFGKRTDMSIKEQRESLPVFKFRKQLLEAIAAHQILVVVGETGSGKTTQMTQYLAEAGYANELMIGCTQPRRVAAMSVAKRVAEEVGCKLGNEVGYTIRFEDCTSPDTKIKYMTDGILRREVLLDPNLSKYSCIMLDEAHERTIDTDVLFGLLKKLLKRRPDMKLIVTSATLDADRFSEYFNKCPIFTIPGRTFPVEIMYSREPESDYMDAALVTCLQVHLTEPPGDILLFLTGKEEIDTACEILDERMKALGPNVPELIILPIYGALPSDVATRIFEPAPPGTRKIVIATNIAETSLTIDGIFYVVDPGFVKQSSYDPKLSMDRLQVTPISQAQARQRSGRAGRTGPGKCFRLYTESAYQQEMLPTTVPEIQRQNLSNTILLLKAMGINDLLHFDFMDPPPTATMLSSLEELYCLGALDDEGLLTRMGRQMADFPMDPSLSKALLKSAELNCAEEVLTIVSMISATPSVFFRPKDKQQQADQKKAKFHDSTGDWLTQLNVYNAWKREGFSKTWATDNFLQHRNLMRVKEVRQQLVQIMQRHKNLRITSCGSDTQKPLKAICSGFFRNSARKDPAEGYKTLIEGTPVYLHPSSALFGKHAEHVIYFQLVETTKEYMHVTSTIDPKWLVEVAPTFFRVAPTDRLSKRKKAERIQPLQNKWAGEDDWRLSAQRKQGRGGGGTWG